MDRLQEEVDRRAKELSQVLSSKQTQRVTQSAQRDKMLEEVRAFQAKAEENRILAEAERKKQETFYAATPEGRLMGYLEDITKAAESTADSARQIRNCIAALIIIALVSFVLRLFVRGV
jgi:hypothetical protein